MKHIKCFLKVGIMPIIILLMFPVLCLQTLAVFFIAMAHGAGCINLDVLDNKWFEPIVFNTKFWDWYKNL